METSGSKKLVLERKDGQVVRTFLLQGDSGHVIERRDTRRLEIVPNLEALYRDKVKFNELGQIRRENLDHLDFDIPGIGKIRNAKAEIHVIRDPELEQEKNRTWYTILFITIISFVAFLTLLFTFASHTEKLDEKMKQEVVQIIKKMAPKPKPVAEQSLAQKENEKVKEKPQVIKTPGVKRMGALGVLGSLKNSNQKGGINLNAVQTTAGPGLGGNAGSGGVQTNIYAKGLVAAPLGAGANVKGAGGYGTKGKGGGQAGYGDTSLMGATGGTSVALASEAAVGGGLDRDAIKAVVDRNMGQVRFCYEQALQNDPGLNGRVAVDFTIGGNGLVKMAQIENSSLGSKIVEGCIVARLKSWKFPLPENGVDVKVSYPFVLRRAGQG